MTVHLEGVHDDGLTAAHEFQGFRGNAVTVADVAERVDAEAQAPKGRGAADIAVKDGKGLNSKLSTALRGWNGEGGVPVDDVPAESGYVAAAGGFGAVDQVGEHARNYLHAFFGEIDVDVSLNDATHGPCAKVVESEDGVGVGMREQDGANGADAVLGEMNDGIRIEGLAAVYENGTVRRVLRMSPDDGSCSASSPILARRMTSGILASRTTAKVGLGDAVDRRYLSAGSRAEEEDLFDPRGGWRWPGSLL